MSEIFQPHPEEEKRQILENNPVLKQILSDEKDFKSWSEKVSNATMHQLSPLLSYAGENFQLYIYPGMFYTTIGQEIFKEELDTNTKSILIFSQLSLGIVDTSMNLQSLFGEDIYHSFSDRDLLPLNHKEDSYRNAFARWSIGLFALGQFYKESYLKQVITEAPIPAITERSVTSVDTGLELFSNFINSIPEEGAET